MREKPVKSNTKRFHSYVERGKAGELEGGRIPMIDSNNSPVVTDKAVYKKIKARTMPANLTQSLDGAAGIRCLAIMKKKTITLEQNIPKSSSNRSKKVCAIMSTMTKIRMFTMTTAANRRTTDFEALIFKELDFTNELHTFLSYPRQCAHIPHRLGFPLRGQ